MRLYTLACLFFLTLLSCQQTTEEKTENKDEISIHTDFEAGSLGKVEQVSKTHWRCAVEGESDWDNRNRQASWYYFRLEGAKDQPLTIELTELVGEYNYKPGAHAITSETRPVISYDQST